MEKKKVVKIYVRYDNSQQQVRFYDAPTDEESFIELIKVSDTKYVGIDNKDYVLGGSSVEFKVELIDLHKKELENTEQFYGKKIKKARIWFGFLGIFIGMLLLAGETLLFLNTRYSEEIAFVQKNPGAISLMEKNSGLVQVALENPKLLDVAAEFLRSDQYAVEGLLKEVSDSARLVMLTENLKWVYQHSYNLYEYLANHDKYKIVKNNEVVEWNNATGIAWEDVPATEDLFAWANAQANNILVLQWKGAGEIPGVLMKDKISGKLLTATATKPFVRFILTDAGEFSGKIVLLHPDKTGVFEVPSEEDYFMYATW